jgi:hypothetical protein
MPVDNSNNPLSEFGRSLRKLPRPKKSVKINAGHGEIEILTENIHYKYKLTKQGK